MSEGIANPLINKMCKTYRLLRDKKSNKLLDSDFHKVNILEDMLLEAKIEMYLKQGQLVDIKSYENFNHIEDLILAQLEVFELTAIEVLKELIKILNK